MPKNGPPPNADQLAERLRDSNAKIAATLAGEGATLQVMAGFADAYRAWLESLSADPQTMLDLQNRYMQEQFRLWSSALDPEAAEQKPVADKRFAGAEWNELPVFRYFRDSY